jgi:endonuclease/exonuclease/phosphatase family metal-dependent hydrolase
MNFYNLDMMKNTMRYFLNSWLALSLVFSLAGCAKDKEKEQEWVEPTEEPVEVPTSALKVMTFNIRYYTWSDFEHPWRSRRDSVYQMVRRQAPDVMGTQEVVHNQLQDLTGALPEYGYVGVGREDGATKGEFCALFYKKERFELLEGSTFWLSETPAVPGMGWDAACERVVSWAKLKEKEGGKVFYAFNTHFDHVGSTARRESALLLKLKIKEIAGDAAVVVTGDFNATASQEPIRLLVNEADPDHLTSAFTASPVFKGPSHSYHAFGELAESQRSLIDYVFVRNVVGVSLVQVLDRSSTGIYISDHYPVLAVVEF